ncbi:hypothetical protein G6F31_018746 [Rhizopus arrhizus]|nr:hypothetical protein G6F31_018746 [Rhizopus arrhizus]
MVSDAPKTDSHENIRSPSQSAAATFSTRIHSNHTAWLAAASAQGSSNTAHQANNSQVSAPVCQERARDAAPHARGGPKAQPGPGGGQCGNRQQALRAGEALHFCHVLPIGGDPANRGAAQQQNA